MSEYMHTKGAPTITDIEPIYDCDSLCVLQCRASAPDEFGNQRAETIRYVFVRDNFASAVSGRAVYLDYVSGGRYLDKNNKKLLRQKIETNGTRQYSYYIGISKPVDSF